MNDKVLKWGLLGTARIAKAIIPAIRASSKNELKAAASRDVDRAAAFAREWKIPLVFNSYETMLEDPSIDVVYNPLPNGLHKKWTLKAVEAGKHVLCEKPLALAEEDVEEIREAAQKAGLVVAEAFMYRHHPQTFKVKEIVDAGMIGKLQMIQGKFRFTLNRRNDIRLDPSLGGGSIWDVGCYPISYARYVIGNEPLEVFGWQFTGASGVDESFYGIMKFPDDVYVQFDSSFRSHYVTSLEIVGSKGSILVDNPFKPNEHEEICVLQDKEENLIQVSNYEASLYQGEVDDIAAAILEGKQQRISLDDSRKNIAVINALLQSAKLGVPVPLGL